MYGGRRNSSAARTLVLALALIGLLYIFFSLRGGQETRFSMWSPSGQVQQAAIANAAPAGLFGTAQGRGFGDDSRPQGNPLGVANTVMTQGYGVGSHAPAATWGAVDLAIDGNGDGSADPDGTWQHPIYATQSGVVTLSPDSWPAGNHIWVANDQYRTGYSHLAGFAASDGQTVRPGDLIGYVGSSGQSSGPHLDYQVWAMQGGQWVNQNPLDFGALDGTR
ncbi:M23 family metallopeptidase [Oscillochloris sp. ZM17-4]|uniref:M23 family metallopeptidase n=1 Tax=Oscillochloris sp. ZM17-4 TaxID=2866714 RepID=UPI001C738151|nr:M23 family metallopeptidase [Oscillochloris sp. ZM17-4]MBX0327795.1 M23 family metallopeptidase [Oscillochloris sp. ZM17-4]